MQMQNVLHGKLEELGLDDILQIIGVSRRTGILTLTSLGREAVLSFYAGLLVRIASTEHYQRLGELLVSTGSVTAETVHQALVVQQQEQPLQRIGTILHQRFNVELQSIENTVRDQIRNVLLTLFAWTEGTYDFSSQIVETVDAAYFDPVQLLLDMEHDDSLPAPPAELQPLLQTLIIVDDDSTMAEAVARALQPWFETATCTGCEDALAKVKELSQPTIHLTVLVDLIMPKLDNSGVLGGLELIHLLHRDYTGTRIIAFSDFYLASAAQEITGLGYPCLPKPRRGDVNGEQFASLLQHLKNELQIP